MKTETKNYILKLPLFIAALFLLASCNTQASSGNNATNGHGKAGEENTVVSFETESVYFIQEELLAEADIIFVGKVLTISPTRWNQDSGEYWTETTVEGVTTEGEQLTTTSLASI